MAVEPTIPTAVSFSLVTGGAAIPVLHVLGVPLGIRPDILMWGLMGGIIYLIHLRAPPPKAGFLQAMLTGVSWVFSLLSSAVTAGFISPALAIMVHVAAPIIPLDISLSVTAFLVGATAQQTLASITAIMQQTLASIAERFNKIIKG